MITNADTGILLTWDDAYWSGIGSTWDDYLQTWILFITETNEQKMAIIGASGASLVSSPAIPGQYGAIEPVLQAQDGSFVGSVEVGDSYVPTIVSFDASGNVRWSVPNDQPQMTTIDGGVIGQSGTSYGQNGSATGQTQLYTYSWAGNTYQVGSVDKVYVGPIVGTTPPYWTSAGGNLSVNYSTPLCHDDRDKLAAEYGNVFGVPQYPEGVGVVIAGSPVVDVTYPATNGRNPRFVPSCHFFTNSETVRSQSFPFAEKIRSAEYGYALIKYPLVVPASSGYGLDAWVQLYQEQNPTDVPRTINSLYRSPTRNAKIGGASSSRHMFGDAVDLANVDQSEDELAAMNTAARDAGAGFVEEVGTKQYCAASLKCAHADWRNKDPNKYVLK